MKQKIWYLFMALLVLVACKDDNEGVVYVDLQENAFSFKSRPGGALMHYRLPNDPDITGLQVRYVDANGKEILRSGSATVDSLSLIGFNEKRENVPAQVRFTYFDGRESQPFNVSFSTEDSAPVHFLKKVEVLPNWGGFSISYDNPAYATGLAHVLYLGTNPLTNESDTLHVATIVLRETDGTEYYHHKIQQEGVKDPTIVIRVEDFRGSIVGQKVWTEVKTLQEVLLKWNTDFSFYCDNAKIDKSCKVGTEYLFDGDTKGLKQWEFNAVGDKFSYKNVAGFIAGPNAAGENAHPMYIDLGENRALAGVKLYTSLPHSRKPWWPNVYDPQDDVRDLMCGSIENETPCMVTLYGLQDDKINKDDYSSIDELEGWEELAKFEQSKDWPDYLRWNKHYYDYDIKSKEELERADPDVIELVVPYIMQKNGGYRYLKIVINEVFDNVYVSQTDYNPRKYVYLYELEVASGKIE